MWEEVCLFSKLFIDYFLLIQKLEHGSYHKVLSFLLKNIKKTMNVEKHVLNGDPKFAKVNGSSNKLENDEQHMH